MEALDETAEQRGNPAGDLRFASLAVRVAGIVRDVDDRGVGKQLSRRLEDREAANAGIEKQNWRVRVHCRPRFARETGARNCRRSSFCYQPRFMRSELLLALALGYLLGSIPFGLVLTRLAGKGDVRDIGSGNIGATNVLRTGSKPLAAATLVLDCLKATAAILLARQLWPGTENFAAAGALVGHLYPVWLRFKGGKGVATLLGVLLPLLPVGAIIYAVVWIGLLLILRISSVAGMIAALSAPVSAAILGDQLLFPMLLAFALLVVWKHKANIARLRAGTEPKVGKGPTE